MVFRLLMDFQPVEDILSQRTVSCFLGEKIAANRFQRVANEKQSICEKLQNGPNHFTPAVFANLPILWNSSIGMNAVPNAVRDFQRSTLLRRMSTNSLRIAQSNNC
jgi:hypothetical protein